MKKTLGILLLLATLVSKSQNSENWRRQLKNQILIQSEKENSILNIKSQADIIAVPTYYYACPGADILQNKEPCKPVIDSFASYAVIMNKDQVKGIAQNTGKGKFGFYTVAELQRLKRKEAEDTTWQMIKLARSHSSNYFFIYFFPGERNRYELMGVVANGKTKYIDRKLRVYTSIQELIADKYTDTKRFIKRIDEQHIKRILQKKMTVVEARKIIEEDYIQYAQYNPWDTAGIMQRFLKEFTAQIQLTTSKKEELKTAILNGLGKSPSFKDKRYSLRIPFFDKNIFPLVSPFATPEELKKYIEYRGIRNWLIRKAYEKLSMEVQ